MDKKVMTIVAIVAVAIVAIAAITVLVLNNQPSGKTINTIEDLDGAKIAVETGTTGDVYATEKYEATKKATLVRYTTYPDAIMDLKNKKVDAIIMDKAPAQAYVKANSGIKILDAKLDSEIENYGFVFKLGNTTLQGKFNTALAELKSEGKIAEIEKY
ncbi:MAG: transporter substrate-binding domain-containing protein [Candidatus Methanomethylophilaceae archaeon]|nr:transporter substrate-binding domain-containing protein [Candidatus Methanomethylophilaceae archaeon]